MISKCAQRTMMRVSADGSLDGLGIWKVFGCQPFGRGGCQRPFNCGRHRENGKDMIRLWNRRLLSLSARTCSMVFFDWRAQSVRGVVATACAARFTSAWYLIPVT